LLRLTSANPYDVQIAVLNLAVLQARLNREEVYLGMCGCEPSVSHRVIVLAAHDKEKCAFCRKPVEMIHMPHFPPLEEGGVYDEQTTA
jgi:hypothetical protein